MAVVSNSSPLIALGQIGQLGLLHQLFHEILIPPAVAREAAASVAGQEWIHVHSLAEPVLAEAMRPGLGEGEREALSLAAEISAKAVIVDDDAARRIGLRLGLPVIGTAGVLLLAKERGYTRAVKPHLIALIEAGFYLSPVLVELIAKRTAE